ncbi:hypothetical protein HA466_0042380 [Hirschfeldia incana]|nr:hypothetical protein HA466_0277240 [Hirschfeldia incana]KAJ0261041.1 hypothetical protein HA466_0042380 [Hirschfeldia incana]
MLIVLFLSLCGEDYLVRIEEQQAFDVASFCLQVIEHSPHTVHQYRSFGRSVVSRACFEEEVNV